MNKLLSFTMLSILLVACGGENPADSLATDGVGADDHRVFVTSTTYSGNLGGIVGANLKCASVAQAAGLKRSYKAIISVKDQEPLNTLAFSGAIYTVDSSENTNLIVSTGSDLWNANTVDLLNQINVDENGETVAVSVWTGADGSGGDQNETNCDEWEDSSIGQDGQFGSTTNTDDRWINTNFEDCANDNALYCISQ